MKTFSTFLKEHVIPGSDYGYWIKPDGSYERVWEHQVNTSDGEGGGHYGEVYVAHHLNKGWVRVVGYDGDSELGFEVDSNKLTKKALASMIEMVKRFQPTNYSYDDRNDWSKSFILDGTSMLQKGKFIAFLRGLKAK